MNDSDSSTTPVNPPVSGDVKPQPGTDEASGSDLWTTKEVAKYLHVSLKTVFNLRKKGLPYLQLGGAVRFDPLEIKSYLMTNRGLASHRLRQIVRKGNSA